MKPFTEHFLIEQTDENMVALTNKIIQHYPIAVKLDSMEGSDGRNYVRVWHNFDAVFTKDMLEYINTYSMKKEVANG